MKNNIWKQNLHLEPKKGWLNDPNGLTYFKGTYYVYHQYSEDPKGAMKLWYGYSSKDLITYKDNGVVLTNDNDLDKSGVYSGSAINSKNEMIFYYTGNVKHKGIFDYVHKGREHNTIKVTSTDGINFSKKELVLKNEDYPNMSNHVRDPKIYEKNGDEYLVLGGRDSKDFGCLLIYKNFKFYKTVYANKNMGYMWECPDYFKVDEKEIFIFSPQGIAHMYMNYNNTYQVGYSVIDEEIENLKEISNFKLLDYGHDFYAPQTFLDEDGNRMMIAWMYVPDSLYTNPTLEFGYQNCLSIPRVLNYSNGLLKQSIHKSIKKLFDTEITENNFNLASWYFKKDDGADFEILIDDVSIKYSNLNLEIDLKNSGYGRDKRKFNLTIKNIEIVFDSSSMEIFINDGKITFSSRFYTNNHDVKINSENYEAYKLKGIEIL